MASKVQNLRLGPFSGLNTRKEAWSLDASEAQAATDSDTFTGALAGTPALSSSVNVNASFPDAQWIWPLGGGTWLRANERRWAMNDGGLTYFTQSGAKPQTADAAGNAYDLGIRPPQAVSFATTTAGTLSGTFKYGISYQTFDGLESNIQNFDLTFVWPIVDGASSYDKISFTSVWPSDARVTQVQLWRTTAGGTIFYRMPNSGGCVGLVTDRAVTSLVDDGSVADGTLDDGNQLTWHYGGYSGNTTASTVYAGSTFTSDHAPARVLTRLADRIHSIAAGVAIAGSGVVFGAVGNILRWSRNGYPQYWPTVNSMPFDHNIEAIIAYSGYVVVFTTGGVFRVSGNNDDAMSNQRLNAGFGVRPGAGKSCLRIPDSSDTIYLAREGLMVFNGSSSQPISTPKIAQADFDAMTIYDAAYFGLKYYLFHSTGYLRCDLRDGWEGARWNTSATVISCVAVADFKNPPVGIAKRSIPTTASATAIQLRRFAFCSGYGATYGNYVWVLGGSKIDLTGPPNGFGETSVATAYALDTSTTSAVWAVAGTLPTDGTATQRSEASVVFINNKLYVFGGRRMASGGYTENYFSSTAINTLPSSWANDATASGPGAIRAHAAAADTTGADQTGFWVHGGIDSANAIKTNLYKYTISGPSWATTSTGGPTVVGHRMVYVPGGVFADGHARLFIFGGSTAYSSPNYHGGGTNIIYCFDLTDNTWSNDATSDFSATVSSAQAAGCAKRVDFVMAYDPTSKMIYVHGGRGTDNSQLSDIWQFNPRTWVDAGSGARVAAWVNTSGAVVNVEDRSNHGGAIVQGTAGPPGTGETLYLAGGSTMLNIFNSDLYAVPVQSLQGPNSPNYSTTAGIYAAKPADGGNIYRMEGGAAQQAVWRTGDVLGENPASLKYAGLGKVDYQGDVTISVFADNGSVQTLATLSSTTRTQAEVKFPWSGATAARGKRLSFRVRCETAAAATSGVAGKLFSGLIPIEEELGA